MMFVLIHLRRRQRVQNRRDIAESLEDARIYAESLNQVSKETLNQISKESLDQVSKESLNQVSKKSLIQISKETLNQVGKLYYVESKAASINN
jgi:hypothetical protein